MNDKNSARFNRIKYVINMIVVIFLTVSVIKPIAAASLKQDNIHVRVWNGFADAVYELHKTLIKNKKLTINTKKGGYVGNKDFYIEKEYLDVDGKLISRISRERDKPENIHVIEVYVYNSEGKVIRDYTAAYLPHYRNAPSQTLISLHQYNAESHAFRSFDASGDRILERCDGRFKGAEVSFMLDEDELYQLIGDKKGFMFSEKYKNCFANLSTTLGKYIVPQ